MTLRKLAIIQARMSSSRLPGKVLLDIAGKPVLQHTLERAARSELLDDVLVATTLDPSDDILLEFCNRQGVACFRGNLLDVLDRYYQAACQFHADVIIRLTADCPLVDPGVLDLTLESFLGRSLDQASPINSQFPGSNSPAAFPYHFAADRLPPPWVRTLPIGLDVEICTFDALQRAWREAQAPHQRENVMPYLYEGITFPERPPILNPGWYLETGTTPRGFRLAVLNHFPDFGSLRWTVDTPEDLLFVREVFSYFAGANDFSWLDVVTLLEQHPELTLINAGVQHKTVYDVDHRHNGQ